MNIDKKNRNLDIDIIELLFRKAKKTNKEITEEMEKLGHNRPTIQRHIVKLRGTKYIIREDDKFYSINPSITDPNRDMRQQIYYGILEDGVISSKLEYTTYLEIELYRRLTKITPFEYRYMIKPEKNIQKIRFSNDTLSLLSKLLYSIIRNVFILNRDTWHLTKDAIYDFFIGLHGEWSKDPKIFEIIKKLRKQYFELGYLPLNLESPFTLSLNRDLNLMQQDEDREIRIKIKELQEKIDQSKTDEDVFKNAIYEETLREEIRERLLKGELKKGEIKMKFWSEEEFEKIIEEQEKKLRYLNREIRVDELKPLYLDLINEEIVKWKEDQDKYQKLEELRILIEDEKHPFHLTKNLKIKWFDGYPQITETRMYKTSDLLKGKLTEIPLPNKNDKKQII